MRAHEERSALAKKTVKVVGISQRSCTSRILWYCRGYHALRSLLRAQKIGCSESQCKSSCVHRRNID